MDYKKKISEAIGSPLVTADDIMTAAEGHGDYALPCFKYARQLRKVRRR